MRVTKLAAIALLALAAVFTTVSGAFAYQAAATTALNVRSGPGTQYGVLGALSANQVVEVLECNPSSTWCRIQAGNLRGWSSSGYLRPIGPSPQPPRPAPGGPDVGFSINTPNFNFSIGSGNRPQPIPAGQVCFFEGYDYNGRSFCAAAGEQSRYIPNFWNDRIRSARVDGNVTATVCTGGNFSGRCAVIDRSVRNLGMLANDISSYSVGPR